MPSESNASCSMTKESRIRDFVNGLLGLLSRYQFEVRRHESPITGPDGRPVKPLRGSRPSAAALMPVRARMSRSFRLTTQLL
jgi:hypothetical protein